MDLENRIWNLDKGEAGSLKAYFDTMSWYHEELNRIIVENWDVIRDQKLLSGSIIRRMRAFYESTSEYADKVDRHLGTEAGRYFEDIIFLPLKTLMQEMFKNAFKLSREETVSVLGKRRPDIIISHDDDPVCILECKVWLDKSGLDRIRQEWEMCHKHDIFFACVTGRIYGEDTKQRAKGIVYPFMEEWFTETGEYEDFTIINPIEGIFEEIFDKCKLKIK